ncbi:hypothetical protein [Acidithiobacillus sp. AMEEHan]|uniref:hypothetical protein n=1 Tax=Acidithiobacillus sp. AMEEHan TaxID=2994951 RepID=UPI0027E59BE9|nr:hypothetical protein [Acidithiobacillus sp. AMEEHan]
MAHAWVQAWLDGEWMLLDATPAAAVGDAKGAIITDAGRLSTAGQLWSWLQWEWLNWVINFTPAKQRAVWRAVGSALRGEGAHSQSPLMDWQKQWSPSWLWYLAPLFSAGLLFWWWRRRRFSASDAQAHYRRRAVRLLQRKGLRDTRPGQEGVWLQRLPLAAGQRDELYAAILRQRYGRHPDAAGEEELRYWLQKIPRWPWRRREYARVPGG